MTEEQSKTPKKNNKKPKRKKKYLNSSTKTGFYYSFFTIVLIFCLIQIGYGAILNVGKIISYKGKMITLENLLKQAKMRNEDLKTEKKVVTSDNSLEGIARNNLKMAGEDEVLIIINQKVEEAPKQKKKWKFKGFSFNKKDKLIESDQAGTINIPQEMTEE